MAKDFGKAPISNKIKEVGRQSAEKANIIALKMLRNENIVDFPDNQEDIKETLDLENSIKEIGFTDPLEVTAFDQEEDKYMIVSGHRRRAAGVKTGMDVFPCVIRYFDNWEAVNNYVLLANSQRDTSKDPLLYSKRYKMHEEYLKSIGFKGSKREEIARRLGISIKHADRYKAMNKVILPIWDLVRDGLVGMSSVTPMAVLSIEDQEQVLFIFNQYLSTGEPLARENAKLIIEEYKNGKKTYTEIRNTAIVKPEPAETLEPAEPQEPPREAIEPITQENRDRKAQVAPINKNTKPNAGSIIKSAGRLSTQLNSDFTIDTNKEAAEILKNLTDTILSAMLNLQEISQAHHLEKEYKELLGKLDERIQTLLR